jgi:hypothetical protein
MHNKEQTLIYQEVNKYLTSESKQQLAGKNQPDGCTMPRNNQTKHVVLKASRN